MPLKKLERDLKKVISIIRAFSPQPPGTFGQELSKIEERDVKN